MNDAPKHADLSLVTLLMEAVRDAVPPGGNEQDVVTYISRPMWRQWCRDLGQADTEPSKLWGQTHARIYGSVTVVVESPLFFAISKPLKH